MKINGFSHIRRWLLLYVAIIVLTTLVAYLYIYNELTSMLAADTLITAGAVADSTLPKVPPLTLAGLKLRILLLLTISFLFVLFFSVLWFRTALHQINRPIHTIRRAVMRLAQGKLNETVALETQDELGQIGASINELAANLQELLLHIWKQSGQCITTVEQIEHDEKQLKGDTSIRLRQLKAAIENLRELAKAYVFYDVHIEGDQIMAINEPGRKGQSPDPASRSSLPE